MILPITLIGYQYLLFSNLSLNETELDIYSTYIAIIFVLIFFLFNYLENRPIIKKVLFGLTLIFFWPFLINIPLVPYHIEGLVLYNATDEINKTAYDLTNNLSNNEEKTKALLNWQLNNINNVYGKFLLSEKPYIAINRASNDYNLGMYYKHGVCGDFGILLSELASSAGIENRRVYANGENHEWVEVKITDSNTSWINADASWSWSQNKYVYNDFKAYGKLSRVYYIDSKTNEQIDITQNYATTGNVSIYVITEKENVTTFNITILSQTNYPVVEGNPEANGFYNYTLGAKKYTVVLKKDVFDGLFYFKAVNQSVFLKENETTLVSLKPQRCLLSFCYDY